MNGFAWYVYNLSIGLRTKKSTYTSANRLLRHRRGLSRDQRDVLYRLVRQSGYTRCPKCHRPVKRDVMVHPGCQGDYSR